MPTLFDDDLEARRAKLRAAGWREAGGLLNGKPLWRRPEKDGGWIMDEDQAFEQFARDEATGGTIDG